MNENPIFCAKVIYGSTALKQFTKFENGKMVTYGYSIHYDRNGIEQSRTKATKLGSIGWDNEEPFTEIDLAELEK